MVGLGKFPRKKTTTTVTVTIPPPSSSAKKLKRQLPAVETPNSTSKTPPTRSSKRVKRDSVDVIQQHSSPEKSKYFDHPSDENEDAEEDDVSNEQDSASGYEDEAVSEAPTFEPTSEEDDEYDSEEDKKKVKRGRKPKSKQSHTEHILVGKNDLWREGVKTGLGPGKAVYIEKPKARGDGGIKYMPERLHPHTFEFLKDLKKNNDRIWLKAHDADFRQSWKDFESFVEALTEKIAEVDETIPELPPKDLVFRIYRDVRFSSDPTPYKPHFSAAWSRTGRKGPYACYYVHIQPGGRCFVGSGLWHPDAAPVALLRTEIDQRSERLRSVLMEARMRKRIFGGVAKDEKKAIRAFCEQNKENALKTKPKGYEADNPNIDLLRLKNFTIGSKISDEEILSPDGLDRVIELVQIMHPFVTYLNSIVMPDEDDANGEEVSGDDEDDDPSSEDNADDQ